MVSESVIRQQLKSIGFKYEGWGRGEISELHKIILPDEIIYECVNGIYDGGFALMLATDIRVLLVDKKPLNYLTVGDMRFDMISEMDYSHRLMGANISISAGDKALKFRSYNQRRLRKLIGHVQNAMADIKKRQTTHQEGQVSHLEQINRQLQTYLVAQHEYQMQLQDLTLNKQLRRSNNEARNIPKPPRPSNELADYLYAQSLMAQYATKRADREDDIGLIDGEIVKDSEIPKIKEVNNELTTTVINKDAQLSDIYQEGLKEIYSEQVLKDGPKNVSKTDGSDINPLNIALSKLPAALRTRKFSKIEKVTQAKATEPNF